MCCLAPLSLSIAVPALYLNQHLNKQIGKGYTSLTCLQSLWVGSLSRSPLWFFLPFSRVSIGMPGLYMLGLLQCALGQAKHASQKFLPVFIPLVPATTAGSALLVLKKFCHTKLRTRTVGVSFLSFIISFIEINIVSSGWREVMVGMISSYID